MSLTIDGVWKVGVWATTVWADGVWHEGAPTPPTPSEGKTGTGGHDDRYRNVYKPSGLPLPRRNTIKRDADGVIRVPEVTEAPQEAAVDPALIHRAYVEPEALVGIATSDKARRDAVARQEEELLLYFFMNS